MAKGSTSFGHSLALMIPILTIADISAVFAFRKHVNWRILVQVCVPCIVGLVVGFLFLGRLDTGIVKRCTGIILLCLTVPKLEQNCCPFSSARRKQLRKKKQLTGRLPTFDSSASKIRAAKAITCPFEKRKQEQLTQRQILLCVVVGFVTVVSNIGGVVLVPVLLESKLGIRQLNGTRAWIFLVMNCLKIPGAPSRLCLRMLQ